ncbi:MAG TPA: S26 family signal peptidase, partial [Bacillota bacterium]|nr:S26 family signal peptidase [Bacillota bacterium]
MEKGDGTHPVKGSLEGLAGDVPHYTTPGGVLYLSNSGQLELLRGVHERGVPLRTMVRGSSMYPFIRNNDVVTIAPLNGRLPRIGEVVACTHPVTGRLVIHRVIKKNAHGWLLQGDNCPRADGEVTGDQIIGRVIRIERGGREVRLGLGAERKLIALLNRGPGLFFIKQIWYFPRRAAGFILRCLQALPLYRLLGRYLARSITVVPAGENDRALIQRRFHLFSPFPIPSPGAEVFYWVARRGSKVIGFVQLVRQHKDHRHWPGYWLFSLQVWPPYR